MNYTPNELTKSVNDGLHPASAERLDGSLRSNCWDFIRISIGNKLYKDRCGKGNFTPFAFPYNGDCTNIFPKKDVREIIVEFKEFLLHVFDSAGKTLLCLQAVQDQLIALLLTCSLSYSKSLMSCHQVVNVSGFMFNERKAPRE